MQRKWTITIISVVLNLAQSSFTAEPVPLCSPLPSFSSINCACSYEQSESSDTKLLFVVNGTKISIELHPSKWVLKCHNNTGAIYVAALPHYEEPQQFDEVWISECALGGAPAAAVLGALRVRARLKLALLGVREPLRAKHVAGLHVSVLMLSSKDSSLPPLDDDFYNPLQNLSGLWTSGVKYERPPGRLKKWKSTNAMLRWLPGDVVAELTELDLEEPKLTDISGLSGAKKLESLILKAPVGSLPPLPALRRFELYGWSEPWPRAAAGYPALRSLAVVAGAARRVPPRWLAGARALLALELRLTPLAALPPDLLRDNAALQSLTIRSANLTIDMLPVDLLKTNANLTTLNLSKNLLTSIPSARFFARLERLSELDLSHNRLRAPPPEYRFPALAALRTLRLDHNPLGDACAALGARGVQARQWSWLQALPALRTLSLRRTAASRLCPDWLLAMPHLRYLDLSDNALAELTYEDLHPVRSQPSTINLQFNNITRIVYTQQDFNDARSITALATVKINSMLRCDCELYWFALAAEQFPAHALVGPLVCAGGRALRLAAAAELACALPCGGCRCRLAPARRGVLAACASPAALRAPANYSVVELSLAGAALAELPAARALPPRLEVLDLRNNSIGGAAGRDAAALLQHAGLRLRLAGNPLDCRCGRRDLVDELLRHKERVLDFEELTCSDGERPSSAECGLGAGVAALLAVLAAVGGADALLLALLAHPVPRARLKTALHALGVRLPGAAGAAGGRAWRYDAFVSFAEADAQWVAQTLVPALESAPAPRRLCLHYRDWAVGELIPRQIAASVRESRRTLLVVSEAFARSAWARAELDEALAAAARDGRPPPLLLLRAPPSPAALRAAPALRDYLRAATYLRADDPAFRERLRRAVPPAPRPPPVASPASPPAAPPPAPPAA